MKPLLAYKPKDIPIDAFVLTLRYPLFATPKIDGIRCIKQFGKPLTRSLKLIPNQYVRQQLTDLCPDWVDGELTCGSSFQAVTSGIMSHEGKPNFTYFVFDYIKELHPYMVRVAQLRELQLPCFCHKLIPTLCETPKELLAYEAECLAQQAEGVMVRSGTSPYKEGRSTFGEHYLIAIKRFCDDEAYVVGYEEAMANENTPIKNELGLTERSSHQANLRPKGTLGALVVCNHSWGQFKIGSGFTDEQRLLIWRSRDFFKNKLVKFKYQAHGSKDKPRIPIFLGFRGEEDVDQ